jgi:hypothetical protein
VMLVGLVHMATSPTGNALMYSEDSITIELAGHARARAA